MPAVLRPPSREKSSRFTAQNGEKTIFSTPPPISAEKAGGFEAGKMAGTQRFESRRFLHM
jgi:hypothetical protein